VGEPCPQNLAAAAARLVRWIEARGQREEVEADIALIADLEGPGRV